MTGAENVPRAATPGTGAKLPGADGKQPNVGGKQPGAGVEIPPPRGWRDPRALAGLPAGAPLCVALSGGADSVTLLLLTPPPVAAVHVHHGIRGAEADRDAEFCRALCERLKIPFAVRYADVPARAGETGESMETAARAERYRLLAEFAAANGMAGVLTAHHADDQLETLLQHLLRGSGLRGMCGIPAVRREGELLLIRPMLETPKEEILAYLAARGETFVTDSTNAERGCTRNRLRLDVLPALKAIAPAAAEKAATAARRMSEDEKWMEDTAAAFLAEHGKNPPAAALAALPRPIFVRVVQCLCPRDLSKVHFEALFTLVCRAVPHSALSLPHGVAKIEGGRLVITEGAAAPVTDYEIPLSPGVTEIPGVGLAVVGNLANNPLLPPKKLYKYATSLSFLSDNIKGKLSVRNRRAGDRILAGGMHRAVRKLPALSALPVAVRQRMPLLADESGLLAVPFYRPRDGAAGGAQNDMTVWFYFD